MPRRLGASAEHPKHFRTQEAFRAWLEKNHDRVAELWIGFYKKATGRKGMTYHEAVDESLCWGWIDGIKKRVDEERYTNRFTPRKPRSKWSDVNLRRYAELEADGRVADPGRSAFARFDPARQRSYSFEARARALTPAYRKAFQADEEAWAFFRAQPPGYRRTAIHWVQSAKREDTRQRRLAQLMEFSAAGRRLPQISGQPAKRSPSP